MKDIRKKMLVGDRPELCQRCFLIEDNCLNSLGLIHNDYFKNRILEVLDDAGDPETHV